MNRELLVHVELAAQTAICGRLWTRSAPRESASFEYDASWLAHPMSFGLEPELPLGRGQFHCARSLFRAFTDPAPDRWGQTLLRRAERARARQEGRAPRTLTAVDFLTLVDDETRLGALRFSDPTNAKSENERTTFLSSFGRAVPPVVELGRLLAATDRIVRDVESDDDLALLLAPGTSLGGARPKASVRGTSGQLLIAKFPRKDDEWPITRWEATLLTLAQAAGLTVPRFRLQLITNKAVLLIERFDRKRKLRVPFMSAMTALSADDNAMRSYLDIVECIRKEGSHVVEDLHQLWRRVVFNVLVSNTDDHLRNHGFVRDERGWRLAPAYDLNPMPADVRPRVHALALDETDATSSMTTAFDAAPMFGLRLSEARSIAREVAKAVTTWRVVGAKLGLKPKELTRMESAFEHEDLALARSTKR